MKSIKSTRTFKLNKLVRDKVYDSMVELGQKVVYRKLSDRQVVNELKAKIIEEANELDPKSSKLVKELADTLEALEQMASVSGISYKKLRSVQLSTRQQRGKFDRKIFIETVTLKDNDPWAKYYAADPKRFPEIK
jgi:predicted house-cleaning noncanonical NTP pyrophosphatase (MazG superfamily)